MKHLLSQLIWRFRGIRVFALVGKSGTGKSFRARLVMQKYGIELLIDDGLLIRDQKIIAGRSAKREKAYLSAVKTALFSDKEHRKQVRAALERERFKRLLIIGTSDRMVLKIADILQLPSPSKIIQIEDIATADEITTAINYRKVQGGHIIPVPSIEVRRNYPRAMTDSIKILFRKGAGLFRSHDVFEKAVVRPDFSGKGRITISEAALSQMIMHCIYEYSSVARIRKVSVKNEPRGYTFDVYLDVPYGSQLSGTIHGMQNYVVENLEKYTGIMVRRVNIVVDTISQRDQRADR